MHAHDRDSLPLLSHARRVGSVPETGRFIKEAKNQHHAPRGHVRCFLALRELEPEIHPCLLHAGKAIDKTHTCARAAYTFSFFKMSNIFD